MNYILLTTISDFFFGSLASLLASFIFLYMLIYIYVPKIKIAPCISHTNDPFDENTQCYIFKIVNKSFHSAFDITVELAKLELYPIIGGSNKKYTNMTLRANSINKLSHRPYFWGQKEYGEHAALFITYEDLGTVLKTQKNAIQIQVTLKHGLTGLSKVYSYDFALSEQIKKGHFEFGSKVGIIT